MTPTPDPTLADIAAALLEQGAATLGECGGVPLRARLRAAWAGARVAGPAFTVSCAAGDNLAIHVGAAVAPAGHVLVVETAGRPELGYWGEVLTTGAEARGLTGLVIDAGVRDTAALEAHRFGVFATMVALGGATKCTAGAVGGLVVVGDVEIRAGDWVVGDDDGVVAIPVAALDAVLAAAAARTANEQRLFVALAQGATTIELLGLDESLVTRLDQ